MTLRALLPLLWSICAVALSAPTASAQSPDWYIVTTVVYDTKSGCINSPATEAGWVWIRKAPEGTQLLKAYAKAVRAQYASTSIDEYTVRPGDTRLFALIRQNNRCLTYKDGPERYKQVTSYRFASGANRQEIEGKMADRQAEYAKEIMSWTIAELIEPNLGGLSNQGGSVIPGRTVSPGAEPAAPHEIVTRDYDGLEVTFVTIRTSSGKTFIQARGRNTRSDSAAVIALTAKGETAAEPIVVPPHGGAFSQIIPSGEGFDIEVQFRAPDDRAPGVIDRLKSLLREHLETKDGIIPRPTVGVRG